MNKKKTTASGNIDFTAVKSELSDLAIGDHKLSDIVKIILGCTTYTQTQLKSFCGIDYDSKDQTIATDDLWVDLSYQRRLKLKHLIDHLSKNYKLHGVGFSREKSGHIDTAYRHSTKRHYVWDGFRRSVMAGVCNMKNISHSNYEHNPDDGNKACREYEAELFLARNSESETMGAAEIFFARVAKSEQQALKMQDVLARANINVLGLHPGGKAMSGFSFVEQSLGYHQVEDTSMIKKVISDDDFIWASETYQNSWPKNSSLVCYLLCGLANTRNVLTSDDPTMTDGMIEKAFTDYAAEHKPKTLTENRVANKNIESVTYNILSKVLKKNGASKKLSGLSDEEIALFDDTADE